MVSIREQLRYRNLGSLGLDEVVSAAGLIEDTQAWVENNLRESLKVYNQIKGKGMGLESCLALINTTLKMIEEDEGFNFFLQLFGLVRYPLDKNSLEKKKLVDIFPKIEC